MALRAQIDELIKASIEAKTEAEENKVRKRSDELKKQLDRSVAVYGEINVRTDGERVVIAQKLEATRCKNKEWDIYQMERDDSGPLVYVSKHEVEGASGDE